MLLALLVAALVAGCGLGPGPAGPKGPGAGDPPPKFDHVYVLILENKEYTDVLGSKAAPYLNGLAARYASLGAMYGETHPSQPNYFALLSGSTQVSDDNVHDVSARNLFDQLEAKGKTWRVFAQNVPLGCYTGETASGGPDGSGNYARKHNPAVSFTDISGNPARCANITDFQHFRPGAADFELIIPNLCNDMHDCSIATGDAFLAGFVPKMLDSPAFARSVLFITFDEGTSGAHSGGQIPTLVLSPLVRQGTVDKEYADHYSILRTIQDSWGLGCLANSCSATGLGRLFGR